MATAKIVVLYPPPADMDAFERAYNDEHVQMAETQITGMSRIVFTRMTGAVGGGKSAFHRMAEIYFPSLDALNKSLASESTQKVAGHAVSISNGGPPLFLIAEES
jgi:uncharacterized protein (TIGR02118 family)